MNLASALNRQRNEIACVRLGHPLSRYRSPGGSGIGGDGVAVYRRYSSVPFVVMRKLYLAGLPRLQSFASVPHSQGSCLADESHTSSTYPLGTMADQTATVLQHCQQGIPSCSSGEKTRIHQSHSFYRAATGCDTRGPRPTSPAASPASPATFLRRASGRRERRRASWPCARSPILPRPLPGAVY